MAATMATKKRTHLNLEQKIQAIKLLDQGKPAYKVAAELGVGRTQISNLKKRKAELIDDFENNEPSTIKRRRYLTGNEDINRLVIEWFKDAVNRRINVTGPLLKTKALEFAKGLNKSDFKASNGWLESFIKRNNIVFGKQSGERGDVDIPTVSDWKSKLGEICSGYTPANIFNMDETGLFYRDTSKSTFHYKGEDCAGGKRSKERLTVALCASAVGEKIRPLVIGKSRAPRCFGKIKVKDLPVDYYFNKKAWMNSSVYEEFLKTLNRKMAAQDRHILLFIDNAPCHPDIQLSHVKLQFLPPNTTSYTQPMDQGIIQTMKLKYRKRQLLHIVKEMDGQPTLCGSELLKQINVLDAIYWVDHSWKEVEASTISKCFAKAGMCVQAINPVQQHKDVGDDDDSDDDSYDDDDVPLAVMKLSMELFGCQFQELVNLDKMVIFHETCEKSWDKTPFEILKDLQTESECVDSDSECEEEEPHISFSAVNEMMTKFKLFARQCGNSNIMSLLSQLDEQLNIHAAANSKQTKINEFFKPRSAI